MGWLSSTAKGGARAGRTVAEETRRARHHRRGVHTEESTGKVRCVGCNRSVRSGMGSVCSRPACHRHVMAHGLASDRGE